MGNPNKLILVCILSACAEVEPEPSIDELWECSADFLCDGKVYKVTSTPICASGEYEADLFWQEQLDNVSKRFICIDKSFTGYCVSTARLCF